MVGLGPGVAGDGAGDVVVGQHPGRRGADGGGFLDGVVDDGPQDARPPWRAKEVELERGVQLVEAQVSSQAFVVGHPGLGDEDPFWRIAIRHSAPPSVDVVHAVLVPGWVGLVVLDQPWCGIVSWAAVGQSVGLHQSVRDVDAEAVDALVEPERQDVLEFGEYLRVLPVEVGLAWCEEVQVPLTVGHPGPGGSAEDALPVVGRQRSVGAETIAKVVALPGLWVAGECGDEPPVLIGAVVGHDVE
jgi:hypothetical protein